MPTDWNSHSLTSPKSSKALALIAALGLLIPLSSACSSSPSSGFSGEKIPLETSLGEFSYRLKESSTSLLMWTAPISHRVTQAETAPTMEQSGLKLSAAKNEHEAVQLILAPGEGEFTVTLHQFDEKAKTTVVRFAIGRYIDGTIDPLETVQEGSKIKLDPQFPTVLWIDHSIANDATAGNYTAELSLKSAEEEIKIPIALQIFDFALDDVKHFATQFNIDVSTISEALGSVEAAKTLLLDYGLTPKSAAWPSGFSWNITWDNSSAPKPCEQFYAEEDEGEDYSIQSLSRKYILGEGFKKGGFATAMLFQFVDNQTPRPDEFCGISRGDHYGTEAYNAAWSAWLSALETYLKAQSIGGPSLLDKSYYYVQNEPQDAEDARLAAHLCRLSKAAAPDLKIAISEEPTADIAEDPGGACGYDIWIAHIRAYQEAYAWQRIQEHGEQVWFYSLPQDSAPYFNPTTSKSEGLHSRIIPWTAWQHRITGWAYYDGGSFFFDGQPGQRATLLREGIEDYQYLWRANGSQAPIPGERSPLDESAASVASNMTSFLLDDEVFTAYRNELGKYIEGSRSELPTAVSPSSRKRGDYAINFQDPTGSPLDSPLSLDGTDWMKVGWDAYDKSLGYGWQGENVGNSAIALYGFDDTAGYTPVEQSYLFDDYGRNSVFTFDIEPGYYRVTVSYGRPAKAYPSDPHRILVEGKLLVDDLILTSEKPVAYSSVETQVADGKLQIEFGGLSPSTKKWSYTFLSSLKIEAIPSP